MRCKRPLLLAAVVRGAACVERPPRRPVRTRITPPHPAPPRRTAFSKVYELLSWDLRTVGGRRSPCFGQPVIIKLSSASFKDLPPQELQREQASLEVRIAAGTSAVLTRKP